MSGPALLGLNAHGENEEEEGEEDDFNQERMRNGGLFLICQCGIREGECGR